MRSKFLIKKKEDTLIPRSNILPFFASASEERLQIFCMILCIYSIGLLFPGVPEQRILEHFLEFKYRML